MNFIFLLAAVFTAIGVIYRVRRVWRERFSSHHLDMDARAFELITNVREELQKSSNHDAVSATRNTGSNHTSDLSAQRKEVMDAFERPIFDALANNRFKLPVLAKVEFSTFIEFNDSANDLSRGYVDILVCRRDLVPVVAIFTRSNPNTHKSLQRDSLLRSANIRVLHIDRSVTLNTDDLLSQVFTPRREDR